MVGITELGGLELDTRLDLELDTRLVCVRCGAKARSHTPFGFMCDPHAIREMLDAAERGEKDWIPFSIAPRTS